MSPYLLCEECGVELLRNRMAKHRAAEHIRCPQCKQSFLRYANRRRKDGEREHVCVGIQQAPQPPDTLEANISPDPRSGYETKLRRKLEEGYAKVTDPEARWSGKMDSLKKNVPRE